jgi:hypothetical protein
MARKTFNLTAAQQAGDNIGGGERENVVMFGLSGTWTATVTFEASHDGVTYTPVAATPAAGGADVTSSAANGAWRVRATGFHSVRARVSAFTSGTIVLTQDVADGTL